MAQKQSRPTQAVEKLDQVWAKIRDEAEAIVRNEPEIGTFIYSSILHHDTLETAVIHRVAQRLDHADVSAELIRQSYTDALEAEPKIGEAFGAVLDERDLVAPARREADAGHEADVPGTDDRDLHGRPSVVRFHLQDWAAPRSVTPERLSQTAPLPSGYSQIQETGAAPDL